MTRIRHLIAVAACRRAGRHAGTTRPTAPSPGRAAGGPAEAAEPAERSEAEPASGARRGPLVKLRDSQFGPVIFNGRDQAAYLFTRDRGGKSRCYGECAVAWPPFYARGKPRAARGVKQSLLGTVARRERPASGDLCRQAALLLRARPEGPGALQRHPGVRRHLVRGHGGGQAAGLTGALAVVHDQPVAAVQLVERRPGRRGGAARRLTRDRPRAARLPPRRRPDP